MLDIDERLVYSDELQQLIVLTAVRVQVYLLQRHARGTSCVFKRYHIAFIFFIMPRYDGTDL